jgi:hypothetical protein
MSKPRFNAILRDGQADGLSVDAIPPEGVTRFRIQDIEDHAYRKTCQALFLKR